MTIFSNTALAMRPSSPTRSHRSPSAALRAALSISALVGLLAACANQPAPSSMPSSTPFAVEEASIADLRDAIRSHRVTSRQLVEAYVARIAALDQSTTLNSIVVVNPQALADADAMDREFATTGTLRPLHGIPIIVKDNFDTAGLQTTGGSLALKGFAPKDDAFMVRRLRDAGAIVLAKSNMAEWAFSPYVTESSIAGITRNPYALDRVPAGSSGGTAAAVAASFGAAGLGSDTGNSIRGPSSHNALVGIRPTIGLTSRDGIIPLFFNNDVGGPMARSVADAALVLNVVAGYDPADPVTAMARDRAPVDYLQSLDPNGLKGARIGVFRRYVDAASGDPKIKALAERAIADLKAQGAIIVDPFVLPEFDTLTKGLWCGDFRADVDRWFATHGQGAKYKTIAEVYASGLYSPYIKPRIEHALEPAGPDDRRSPCADVYHDAPKIAFRNALLAAMERDHLDAIVYPTWSNPPRKVGDTSTPPGDNSQVLSPQTGFPAITVPMGFVAIDGDEVPAGITFLGRTLGESTLIKYAYAYEQATHHRKAPARFGPVR
jgi:amidase